MHCRGANVKRFPTEDWDGQGASYPPCEDKVYDLETVSEAKEDVAGAGGKAPAGEVP